MVTPSYSKNTSSPSLTQQTEELQEPRSNIKKSIEKLILHSEQNLIRCEKLEKDFQKLEVKIQGIKQDIKDCLLCPFNTIVFCAKKIAEFVAFIFSSIATFFTKLFCCIYCKVEPTTTQNSPMKKESGHENC